MARGGARPGAGRPARKSANTSTVSRRARTHAREAAGNQRPWPADKVERWAIDRLIPYARNARTHTDAQVAAIAASIKEWGWTTPALVGEDGGLIAGHARVLAARQLGIAEIPVMVAAGWSEAQKRAYVLADNQLAITGSGLDDAGAGGRGRWPDCGPRQDTANTSPPSTRARAGKDADGHGIERLQLLGGEGEELAAAVFVSLDDLALLDLLAGSGNHGAGG
jgi:hypothetical protein